MLAVVIPAYKERYLRKSLQALADQYDKRFCVYIGDDCSPYNLKKITDDFTDFLDIRYFRFENNIGAENLVNQWTRCIALTQDEDWLWLFSDDDLVDSNAVGAFYSLIESKKNLVDVCRFNTKVIDSEDNIMSICPTGPAIESSLSMAYAILTGQRGNSMPDHIFSRKIYNKKGGFVYTKFAQGADWATSILFSSDKGMFIIPDATVYWRYSGTNISSVASANKKIMISGHLDFLSWLSNFFWQLDGSRFFGKDKFNKAIRQNFVTIMIHHYRGISVFNVKEIYLFYSKIIKINVLNFVYDMCKISINTGYSPRNLAAKLKSFLLK